MLPSNQCLNGDHSANAPRHSLSPARRICRDTGSDTARAERWAPVKGSTAPERTCATASTVACSLSGWETSNSISAVSRSNLACPSGRDISMLAAACFTYVSSTALSPERKSCPGPATTATVPNAPEEHSNGSARNRESARARATSSNVTPPRRAPMKSAPMPRVFTRHVPSGSWTARMCPAARALSARATTHSSSSCSGPPPRSSPASASQARTRSDRARSVVPGSVTPVMEASGGPGKPPDASRLPFPPAPVPASDLGLALAPHVQFQPSHNDDKP
jgi:hypothetical protein